MSVNMDNNDHEFISNASPIDIGGSIGCTFQPLHRRSPKRSKHEKGTASPISTISCLATKNTNSFAQILNSELNDGVQMEVDWPYVYDEWESFKIIDHDQSHYERRVNDPNGRNCSLWGASEDDYSLLDQTSLTSTNALNLSGTGSAPKLVSSCPFDEASSSCLPIEVSLHILTFLDLQTLVNVRAVNRTLRNVLDSEDSENGLWMLLYETNWTFLRDVGINNLKLDEAFESEMVNCVRSTKEAKHKAKDEQNINQSKCWPIRRKQSKVYLRDYEKKEAETFVSPSKSNLKKINHAVLLSISSPIPTCIDKVQMSRYRNVYKDDVFIC
jgi:F-box domain